MSSISPLVVLLVVVSLVPTVLYLGFGRGQGRVWGLVPAGSSSHGEGVYRKMRMDHWRRGAAPPVVRAAAISSFFLGQMVVPGVLAALVGFIALLGESRAPLVWIVLQLSSPTGVVVAIHVLSAGAAMLARDHNASEKARRAARWALWHNLLLLLALGLAAAVEPREAYGNLVVGAYCLVSIAHALLLRRAAHALDAYSAAQMAAPAPIDLEIAALSGTR
jgi:hypothetical protein